MQSELIHFAQSGLLPLKKVPGKPDKNFKRPQARPNGAAQGLPERAKPTSGEPGIERSAFLGTP